MYDVYFWPTPNGYKPLLMLEEINASYELLSINIGAGEQFDPVFLKHAPNNRIPAIIDREPSSGEESLSVFESGAILVYLAEKSGRFLPSDSRERAQVFEWLMWQMGGLGPMAGQAHHFLGADENNAYGIDRYTKECVRLYGVMNRRLENRDYLAGDYSIADMACYPWIWRHKRHLIDLQDYTNVKAWYERISERPATARASERGMTINPSAERLLA